MSRVASRLLAARRGRNSSQSQQNRRILSGRCMRISLNQGCFLISWEFNCPMSQASICSHLTPSDDSLFMSGKICFSNQCQYMPMTVRSHCCLLWVVNNWCQINSSVWGPLKIPYISIKACLKQHLWGIIWFQRCKEFLCSLIADLKSLVIYSAIILSTVCHWTLISPVEETQESLVNQPQERPLAVLLLHLKHSNSQQTQTPAQRRLLPPSMVICKVVICIWW